MTIDEMKLDGNAIGGLLREIFNMEMTAAETTGPASGPQPASSTPATSAMPFCQSSRSYDSRFQNFALILPRYKTMARGCAASKHEKSY